MPVFVSTVVRISFHTMFFSVGNKPDPVVLIYITKHGVLLAVPMYNIDLVLSRPLTSGCTQFDANSLTAVEHTIQTEDRMVNTL